LADSWNPEVTKLWFDVLDVRDGAVKLLRDKHIDLQVAALIQSLANPDLKEDKQR